MKKCGVCGVQEFDTAIHTWATVAQYQENGVIEVVQAAPDGHVAEGEITGDLTCKGCGKVYDKWDDIPDPPDDDEED